MQLDATLNARMNNARDPGEGRWYPRVMSWFHISGVGNYVLVMFGGAPLCGNLPSGKLLIVIQFA